MPSSLEDVLLTERPGGKCLFGLANLLKTAGDFGCTSFGAFCRGVSEVLGMRQAAPDGVATLKVRKGAFEALNRGSGALEK